MMHNEEGAATAGEKQEGEYKTLSPFYLSNPLLEHSQHNETLLPFLGDAVHVYRVMSFR